MSVVIVTSMNNRYSPLRSCSYSLYIYAYCIQTHHIRFHPTDSRILSKRWSIINNHNHRHIWKNWKKFSKHSNLNWQKESKSKSEWNMPRNEVTTKDFTQACKSVYIYKTTCCTFFLILIWFIVPFWLFCY